MPPLTHSALCALIRWKLARGTLPLHEEHQRVCDGWGANQECDGCGQSISASDVLFEVEAGNSSRLVLHRQCFNAWLMESRACMQTDVIGSAAAWDLRPPVLR